MTNPITCFHCEGTGWVTCCEPQGHMCPGTVPCHMCEGAGKLIEVKDYKPYRDKE